jgi:hypothetical protein
MLNNLSLILNTNKAESTLLKAKKKMTLLTGLFQATLIMILLSMTEKKKN